MTYEQAIQYFGGLVPMAEKLGLPKTTVHSWKRRENIPWAHQYDIEQVSNGKLKAEKRNGG